MKSIKSKGIPASWTMAATILGSILTYVAKHRKVEGIPLDWKVSEWEDGPKWTADISQLPGYTDDMAGDSIAAQVFGYGIRKVLEDRSSQIEVGPAKLPHYQKTFDRLVEGHWKAEREAPYRVDLTLVRALASLKPGISEAAVEATLKAERTDPEKLLASSEALKAVYDRLKAEAVAQPTVDLSDLLKADDGEGEEA